jgi:hypothetical protein
MTGPKAARSRGADADEVLLGDATALTTGGLMAGAALDGNELGSPLAEATDAGDEAALRLAALGLAALVALAAE